ncbi:protein ACCELERATED CELL DEATH 6-like isoform X1 [Triticum urartu]|nr:protein ACCELERATED CELL DEATH 6-like isoform X1 [Triticum urartu]
MFLNKSPTSAGLRDSMGRTFLHVAAEKKKVRIVSFVCRNRSLSSILNMQDNDGNTALHLAIQTGSLPMFCALLGNRQIRLNLPNKKRQTALDMSQYKIPSGFFDDQNSEARIHFALKVVSARSGGCRRDHFEENYNDQLKHYEKEELAKVKDSTQTLCIAVVLIATMTFGATFALPGGYRADEHTNGGTPTLSGSYAFDAFIIASTLSFILSAMAIVGLIYSGYYSHSRKIFLLVALYFGATSVTCFTAAFALGLYMVLAPVAHKSAVTICVIIPFVVLCNKIEFLVKWVLLARSLCTRIGLIRTLVILATKILCNLLMEFWPIIFIFVWATYIRN